MQEDTKRSAAIVAGVAAVLMVLVFKWFAGAGSAPATAIPDTLERMDHGASSVELRHQPTVIRAAADLAPPRLRGNSGAATPSGFDRFVSDRGPVDDGRPADVEFLPIPRLDSPPQP